MPDIEKVIYMHVISIIAENKSHAHHNTHLHSVNYAVASGLNERLDGFDSYFDLF